MPQLWWRDVDQVHCRHDGFQGRQRRRLEAEQVRQKAEQGRNFIRGIFPDPGTEISSAGTGQTGFGGGSVASVVVVDAAANIVDVVDRKSMLLRLDQKIVPLVQYNEGIRTFLVPPSTTISSNLKKKEVPQVLDNCERLH